MSYNGRKLLIKSREVVRMPMVALLGKSAPWLHRYWTGRIADPVFIVGCPRSGTTIFGRILSEAPDFLYLNEPRYIWCRVNPMLDIWGYRNPCRDHGKLYWDAEDVIPQDADRLARWFHLVLFMSRRRRLVEKLPINVFRMRWLNTMFPAAKFIHVIRHGRDVSLSLANIVARWRSPGHWETSRGYGRFRTYAANIPELYAKLGYITENSDNYPRGLFVWLCCVTEGRQAGHELGPDKYLEVRYEDMVSGAEQELGRVFNFLAEPLAKNVVDYANSVLRADSINKPDPNSTLTKAIAGDLLEELRYNNVSQNELQR